MKFSTMSKVWAATSLCAVLSGAPIGAHAGKVARALLVLHFQPAGFPVAAIGSAH